MTTELAQQPKSGYLKFKADTTRMAKTTLAEWVGPEQAGEAVGRIATALSSAAASARRPQDFYDCTPASVASCIAMAALVGIMPGSGSAALAYVVPQRPRQGEPPQLQYSLSHRGLNALARRCGQTMVATPVGMKDTVETGPDGTVQVIARDIDHPPTTFDDLRGVLVVVKELSSGVVVCREWVPKVLIEQRRGMSRSFTGKYPEYSPWATWPVEMAIKTAMHYAIARGWCVIDDTSATRALSADVEADLRLPSHQPARIEHDDVATIDDAPFVDAEYSESDSEQEPTE